MGQVFIQPGIWLNGVDVTSEAAAVEAVTTKTTPEATDLASEWTKRLSGVRDFNMSVDAFVDDAAALAAELHDELEATDGGIWSLSPVKGGMEGQGQVAYLGRPKANQLTPIEAAHGDVHRCRFGAQGDGKLGKGIVLWAGEVLIQPANSYQVIDNVIEFPGTGPLVAHLHVIEQSASATLDIRVQRAATVAGSLVAAVTPQSFAAPGAVAVDVGASDANRWFRLSIRSSAAPNTVKAAVALAAA